MTMCSFFMFFFLSIYGFVTGQGSVSPITLSQSPFQTLNSNVSASTVGRINYNVGWDVLWTINGVHVGTSSSDQNNLTKVILSTAYKDRISITGFYPNSSNPFVLNSTLTLFNLQPSDNNITAQAGTGPPTTVTLNVAGCSTSVGGCSVKTCSCSPCSSYGCIATFGCPGCEVMATCKENATWSVALPCIGASQSPCPPTCIGVVVAAILLVIVIVAVIAFVLRRKGSSGEKRSL